jgi:ATP-dependent DNA ligase
VVAKDQATPYAPGARTMLKVKHTRSADVVVAGYRLHKSSTPDEPKLGSLLLGLYDADGHLQHVGVSAAFSAARRAAMVAELEPLRLDPADLAGHPWGGELAEGLAEDRRPARRADGTRARICPGCRCSQPWCWRSGYDHMEGTRFRHTAQFKRWRTDRDPESCTYEQLEEPVSYDLRTVLGTVRH